MKRSDETSPIINFLFNVDRAIADQYLQESLSLMKARMHDGLSSLERHKKILGKQNYCWTGFVRHWVWETDTWRVYVSKEGASFEVLATLTPDEAWQAWQDYYNRMKEL